VAQAAAQDIPDDQEMVRIYQESMKATAACQALPWDVSQSINLADGKPVAKIPAYMSQYMNDANVKNQLNNCITQVANSNEKMFKQDKVNQTLVQKLRTAVKTFVTYIASVQNLNKNVIIQNEQLKNQSAVTMGIRG
jgi:hypothetical protein